MFYSILQQRDRDQDRQNRNDAELETAREADSFSFGCRQALTFLVKPTNLLRKEQIMGREVRRVPADWQHPKDDQTGRYKPLYPGEHYAPAAQEFMDMANKEGLQAAINWHGQAPDKDDYMPDWPAELCTHLMMYEDTTEGTPISPAFATPEELAHWLADTGASAFGDATASYEGWLRVAHGGFAPSAVYTPQTGMVNGVDAL